jgi:hypothetical protein
MTNAIVTITCPSCGGRVEGVRATNEDQTVKCTFCGTDLHIPRIGAVVHERVVREVVHEVESAPVYTNDAVSLRPKRNPVYGLIAAGLMLPLLGIFMCVENRQAQRDIDQFDQQEADRKACSAKCAEQCQRAGDKETGKWDMPYMNDGSSNIEQQMKDTDVLVCKTDCEMKDHCLGI